MNKPTNKTTLILSGGGSWNSYVAGWLTELISIINPDTIIGSSGGALLGASLLSGVDVVSPNLWSDISKKAIKPWRIFSSKMIDTKFLQEVSTNNSEELFESEIELIIPTTNEHGGISYFSSKKTERSKFLSAIRGTCSIPIQSKRISIDGLKHHDTLASSMPHHHIDYAKQDPMRKVIVINMMRPYPRIMWIERTASRFIKEFNLKNYQKTLNESFELRDAYGLKEGNEMSESENLFVYQPFEVRERIGFLSSDIEKLQEEITHGRKRGNEMKKIISQFLNK